MLAVLVVLAVLAEALHKLPVCLRHFILLSCNSQAPGVKGESLNPDAHLQLRADGCTGLQVD